MQSLRTAHLPMWQSGKAVDGTFCRIKVGAIDAAALGPFKNSPTTTDEKKESFLFWL